MNLRTPKTWRYGFLQDGWGALGHRGLGHRYTRLVRRDPSFRCKLPASDGRVRRGVHQVEFLPGTRHLGNPHLLVGLRVLVPVVICLSIGRCGKHTSGGASQWHGWTHRGWVCGPVGPGSPVYCSVRPHRNCWTLGLPVSGVHGRKLLIWIFAKWMDDSDLVCLPRTRILNIGYGIPFLHRLVRLYLPSGNECCHLLDTRRSELPLLPLHPPGYVIPVLLRLLVPGRWDGFGLHFRFHPYFRWSFLGVCGGGGGAAPLLDEPGQGGEAPRARPPRGRLRGASSLLLPVPPGKGRKSCDSVCVRLLRERV